MLVPKSPTRAMRSPFFHLQSMKKMHLYISAYVSLHSRGCLPQLCHRRISAAYSRYKSIIREYKITHSQNINLKRAKGASQIEKKIIIDTL